MALVSAQIQACAAQVASHLFQGIVAAFGGATQATASVNWQDLQNAVQAVDAGFDTTLASAQSATGGTTTVINYLASTIPSPVSGGSSQQKTILAIYVLAKRAGLI
jgi:hypothetical protein